MTRTRCGGRCPSGPASTPWRTRPSLTGSTSGSIDAMIATADRRAVLSSMGWVEGDALWRFDIADGRVTTIPLGSGAQYLTLHDAGDRFAVAHHFDGRRFEVSVRACSEPDAVLARATAGSGGTRVDGDSGAWRGVPRLYVPYLAVPPWSDYVLMKIDAPAGRVEIQELSWYDESYDKGYQGVISVLELPDRRHALISVQRSSRLILHDIETGARRRTIDLGGQLGNPQLYHRAEDGEVWATDYDTVAVVRADDWSVRKKARIQGAAPGTQQFIGDLAFAPDTGLCVVARPFSGDVVAIDRRTLRIQSSAPLGAQPLLVAALANGEIVARDWKTGALLRGRLGD